MAEEYESEGGALEPVSKRDSQVTAASVRTAQECRVTEVSEALTSAYQRASTLELTDEEAAALMAPFPDDAVSIRPHDGLIYIEHIEISDRLNHIFRPGQWCLIRRREWYDQNSSCVYGEYVLVIRGCYVGESVGGHPFVAKNPKTNYSDALEATAAEALRRIAGKRLSCGSQVWRRSYADRWVRENAESYEGRDHQGRAKTLWRRKGGQKPPPAANGQPKEEPLKTIPEKDVTDARKMIMNRGMSEKLASEFYGVSSLDKLPDIHAEDLFAKIRACYKPFMSLEVQNVVSQTVAWLQGPPEPTVDEVNEAVEKLASLPLPAEVRQARFWAIKTALLKAGYQYDASKRVFHHPSPPPQEQQPGEPTETAPAEQEGGQ